ncbi:MAG: 7-carboxy-7-deazaguanine synthase [Candidatus Marinimicrobia bacterium]|nr:7-carboxy-7-deazaguanine synthase [Candidatus Neomarinimicrobiota bacterium]
MKLKINEIFYSIQGESSYTGLPCVFIRLTYCNLRCSYCDSEYAFYEGRNMSFSDINTEIKKYPTKLAMITGGEPLLQKKSVDLMQLLIEDGYSVMLETSGSLSLENVPKEVIKIVDFKCPSSKMKHKNDWSILNDIDNKDEIKFVIGNEEDYNWSKSKIVKYNLNEKCQILFSPIYGSIDIKELCNWILNDGLNVRLQTQLHKLIWGPDKKGV